jgi:ankyrin repeat protein
MAQPDIVRFGRTALWWAAERGNEEIVRLLVDAKANLNVVTEVRYGAIY